MDHREASGLLRGAGVDLRGTRTAELLELTEGWAAGLYLAALAIRAGARESGARPRFSADDRFMGDYLRSEFLDHLSDDEVLFLTRTSVLDTMCGSLCDAVLARDGSAKILDELETRNLLVIALDRRREWYRYHHLFRELLQAELRQREPGLLSDLHFQAAAWYEANGLPEVAIAHAQQAGDFDHAARLVLDVAQPVWASGRVDTVLDWMESLRDKSEAQYYSAIAVHGAMIFALLGQASEAERWATAAERAPASGVLPDGSTVASNLAYLRALLFRAGVNEMRYDAQLALDGLSPGSPYRATMLHTIGLADLLQGDIEKADAAFAHAFEVALNSNASPLAAMVLAERCIVSAERDDWAEVTTLAQRAVEIVEDGRFQDYWTSALVFAWGARAALHRSDVDGARGYLTRANRLRPLLTYALPAVSVQALLDMAAGYIALADPSGSLRGPQAGTRHHPAAARHRPAGGRGRENAGDTHSVHACRGRCVLADGSGTEVAAPAVNPSLVARNR